MLMAFLNLSYTLTRFGLLLRPFVKAVQFKTGDEMSKNVLVLLGCMLLCEVRPNFLAAHDEDHRLARLLGTDHKARAAEEIALRGTLVSEAVPKLLKLIRGPGLPPKRYLDALRSGDKG